MLAAMLPSQNVLANPSIHRAVQVLGHGHGGHCSARPHWTSGWPIYCEAFRLGRPVVYGCLLFRAFWRPKCTHTIASNGGVISGSLSRERVVLSGLVTRRAQLAGDIENTHEALRKMVLDLENLDATIVQFDPDFNSAKGLPADHTGTTP